MNLQRQMPPDPYDLLPQFPAFELVSETFEDGARMPEQCTAAGGSISPHLRWAGAPAGTKSFVVTCLDPDAPTGSGFWHWGVVNIPAHITEFALGAGAGNESLPGGVHVRNDANEFAYMGAAPPPGDFPHRYMFVVRALDVEAIEGDPEQLLCARVSFRSLPHVLAQARITAPYSR